MRRLWLTALMLMLQGGAALAQTWLSEPVNPDDLTLAERRLVQAALVISGDYLGPVEGVWNGDATVALADYTASAGHRRPQYRDLAPLLAAFETERQTQDWQVLYFEDTDSSIALPMALLIQTEVDQTFAWEAEDGSLSVSFDLEAEEEAQAQHRLIYARRNGGADRYQLIGPDLLLTSVTLKDGTHAYVRSKRGEGGFATLLLLADDAQYPRLALVALSAAGGQMEDLGVPEGGVLAAVVAGAAGSGVADEKPVRRDEPPVRRDLSPKDAGSTGSGFYVNAGNIVTAAHVVEGCEAMSLSDGTPVGVVLADGALDLAVLQPEQPSGVWLNLQADVQPRLGETVYALGYPYLGLLNQGLAVTGGNISAMGGIDPGEVRIMVSAPVQPGNSGGPLVNARGDVVGVVVSRIDDMSIFDQTGTLPQNMNFAVPPAALMEFLDRAKVKPTPIGVEEIDISRGLPDKMRDSVVPLFCY